jgi:hypothetical protein
MKNSARSQHRISRAELVSPITHLDHIFALQYIEPFLLGMVIVARCSDWAVVRLLEDEETAEMSFVETLKSSGLSQRPGAECQSGLPGPVLKLANCPLQRFSF